MLNIAQLRITKHSLFRYLLLPLIIWFAGCGGSRELQKNNAAAAPEYIQSKDIAEEHYMSGALYDFEENYEEALKAYLTALKYDTSSAQIYKAIGRSYIRLRQRKTALHFLEKARQLAPTDRETLYYLAETYYEIRDFDNAEKCYQDLLALDPYNESLMENLAHLYRMNNQTDKLMALRKKQLQMSNWDIDVASRLWSLYVQSGKLDQALALSDSLTELYPENPDSWLLKGSSEEFLKDTTAAIQSYRQLLTLDPENDRAMTQLFGFYAKKDNWAQLAMLLTELIDLHPRAALPRMMLAEVWTMQDRYEDAVKVVEPLLSDSTQAVRASLFLGRLAARQNRFDSAKQYFQSVTQSAPNDPRAWEFLALLQFRQGNMEEALSILAEAVRHLPDEFSLLSLYGSALQQANRYEEALIPLQKAHEIDPSDLNTIVSLGLVYDELQKYSELDSLYESALETYPDNPLLLNNYSYSLSERNIRLDKALEMSQKAVMMEPNNAAYLDTMGWIYYQLGEYTKALEWIQKSLALEPDNPEVVEHLGDVYAALGQTEAAVKQWQQALELQPDNQRLQKKLNESASTENRN